jgi:hypothetical protein
MFITNRLTPAEMLSELLAQKGYTNAETERFKTLRHNRDLCPQFRERVSAMLDAYKSHRTDVLDTQGPRDEGVDVMLKYYDGEQHRLGLQIKSYDEIKQWAKGRNKNFILTLKAQYTSAIQNVKVDDYYLLLCTDEIDHEEQIRSICSELKQFERLTIVRPRRALAFYEMADVEVWAFVTRVLCKDDGVLEAALETVSEMPGDRAYLTLALVCRAFEGDIHVTQDDLMAMYADWVEMDPNSDPEGDRIADLVQELEGAGLVMTDSDFVIEIGALPTSLCATYFDQKQRHGGDMLLCLIPNPID